jgi:predicted TIM-barrel fold metal-dependent hydrolase
VEYFAGRFGVERCLFGTGLLAKAPGAARGFLDWSLLPEADVAKIAGGNLTRLLRGAAPAGPAPRTPWEDALTAAARAGRPLPCEIWDNHCHILHDGGERAGGGLVFHRGDAAGMLEVIRRVGITKTAIMSWEGPCSQDTDLGNDTVEQAVARYPEAFIGLATINPEHQTEAQIAAVIQKYHVQLRFPGLKTLTIGQNLNYDDPAFRTWYAFGDRHRLYAVIDPSGREDSDMIANLVRLYPNLRISLDHCGQSWPYARWAAEMVDRYPNVDAQLTFTNVTNGVIEYLVDRCGADRVMFGTDTPMRDPRPQVGWLVFTRLSEPQKRLVFGENFRRLLERVTWEGV